MTSLFLSKTIDFSSNHCSITDKKLDKDRFRKDLGDLIPAYTEVAKRLGILHEQSNVSAVNVTKLSSVKKKSK